MSHAFSIKKNKMLLELPIIASKMVPEKYVAKNNGINQILYVLSELYLHEQFKMCLPKQRTVHKICLILWIDNGYLGLMAIQLV